MITASQAVQVALIAGMLAGCAGTPAPFPIRTDPAARRLLTGEWVGTYSGGQGGRSGSITFILQGGDSSFTAADGEHAHGDVLMVPNGQDEPLRPAEMQNRDAAAQGPEVLSIRFVRARGTQVSGTLNPYHDPTCNCSLSTSFVGEITGDVIKGTFTTRPPNGPEQSGEWEIRRKKP